MLTIDIQTARRFILGTQGLWPGRRWRGIKGTEKAMRAIEYLQLDPLQIIARSQDITLHSRVLDYLPGMWEDLTYRQRKFFDWGDWLFARFDSKFDDRTTTTFVILGFWPDDKTLAKNEIFAEALARGFSRFAVFLGAVKLDVKGIPEPLLRRRAGSFIH